MKPVLVFVGEGVIGPYIMEDLADALEAAGQPVLRYRVSDFYEDLKTKGAQGFETWMKTLGQSGARWALGYGATGLLPVANQGQTIMVNELLGLKIALLWFDDPIFSLKNDFSLVPQDAVHFCWDSYFSDQLRQRGFRVFDFPLATNPKRFGEVPALPLKDEVRFVGRLPDPEVVAEIRRVSSPDLVALFDALGSNALADLSEPCHAVVEAAVSSLGNSAFSEVFGQFKETPDYWTFVYGAMAEISGARRKGFLAELAKTLPVAITGDQRWQSVPGVKVEGECAYGDPGPYAGSLLTLDIPVAQLAHGVNQRLFDVPLCGGLLATVPKNDISKLFPDDLMLTFETPHDVAKHMTWARENPTDRKALIAKQRQHVLAHHTWESRVKILLEVFSDIG